MGSCDRLQKSPVLRSAYSHLYAKIGAGWVRFLDILGDPAAVSVGEEKGETGEN